MRSWQSTWKAAGEPIATERSPSPERTRPPSPGRRHQLQELSRTSPPTPAQRNPPPLSAIGNSDYGALRAAHIRDHQYALPPRLARSRQPPPPAQLPTDERIAAFANGNDPALVALLFQFGRYLMIGSSRPGGQPANLQGLWNDSNTPAWDSKYTDNINTEMNYWPVEETNLSECHLPLFDALKDLVAIRRHHRQGAVQRARLGAAPQLRPVARHRAHQCQQSRHLADRRRLALHPPLGALPLHRRSRVPAHHRLPADEGRGHVLHRRPGERSQNRPPVHRPQQLAGTGRPGHGPHDGPRNRAHPLRRNHRRRQSSQPRSPPCASS